MPPFMRVNPILDWHYGHIWHFLRRYELPYCSLYDKGYTSLGKVDDTLPNPALARPDGSGEYYPAYMLQDWTQERAGRIDKKKLQQQQEQKEQQRKDEAEAEVAECELRDFEEMRRQVGRIVGFFVGPGCLSLSLLCLVLGLFPAISTHAHVPRGLPPASRRSTPRQRASSSSGTRS
jgi:FAD synthetase